MCGERAASPAGFRTKGDSPKQTVAPTGRWGPDGRGYDFVRQIALHPNYRPAYASRSPGDFVLSSALLLSRRDFTAS